MIYISLYIILDENIFFVIFPSLTFDL